MMQYEIDRNDRELYPVGLTRLEGGIHISVASATKDCCLLLFPMKSKRSGNTDDEPVRIAFPEDGRIGDIWEMTVRGEGLLQCYYALEAEGKRFPDPCGRSFIGREKWGEP